ncbi:MAG: NTP transferase domain-containing protein [Henriciella sp.]|nr:NTP transferase domain-containing protein [Henriciella sp.]
MSWDQIAVILLASGQSSRFEAGDKLLASFQRRKLIDHAGALMRHTKTAARIGVVAETKTERQQHLTTLGWQLTLNGSPDLGLSHSLGLGIAAAEKAGAEAALILLADMPRVSESHLNTLYAALSPDTDAVMSVHDNTISPPALFRAKTFASLMRLNGDSGARDVFACLDTTETVELPRHEGLDVDRLADLSELENLSANE